MAKNEVESLRKITLKSVGAQADIEKLLKAEGKRVALVDIYGIASRAKPGQSDFGTYCRFLGSFRAVNLETKQTYESNVCLLPRFIEEGVQAALGMDGAVNVEFAVRISAKYDASAATKYVYDAKNLLPTKEQDAMVQLAVRVGEATRLLENKK